jgi:hypothetical protein
MNKMRLISHYDCYGRKDYWDANSDVYAITDDFVMKSEYKSVPKDKKVALLIEPRAIVPEAYDYVGKHYNEFKYVFTGDDELRKLPNAKPIIWGGVWYREENPKKTKLISMVCSDKEMCDLHKERKRIARKYKDKIDVYGTIDGGEYVDDNIHKDYMYEVVIENDIQDIWFTEKICNCLANKTIPIYYGARDIFLYFDTGGMEICKSIEEVEQRIDKILKDPEYAKKHYYGFRRYGLEKNYELSKQYEKFDEWFYKTYEKEIGEMF